VLAARRRKLELDADHHHVRVVIETMLRANHTEKAIVAAVRRLTVEPRPAGALSTALRAGAAWLRRLLQR
jgi:hypothetical protein